MTEAPCPALYTIPAGIPFARALADGIVADTGGDPLALADTLIFVPTRRAARTLTAEFVRAQGGAALGPRIRALGDLDGEDIGFDPSTDDITLAPAIAPLRRRLLLARLVSGWAATREEPLSFGQAFAHAGELARLLDETATQRADLAALRGLAPAALADHWQEVLGFLSIVAEHWPGILLAEGRLEPAVRRNRLLERLAKQLAAVPPKGMVIAAGSTGSIPATGDLLAVIAGLPNGAVVLPGLDTDLDAESWDALDPAHAQYGLRQLLERMDAERGDVKEWPHRPGDHAARAPRVQFLSEALRPPPTTDSWRRLLDAGTHGLAAAFDRLSLIEAANPREEALVIAMALREALETPGRTAALVTPDRRLARRVAAELTRWDIAIDDSAGVILTATPPGAFLTLLAEAAADQFAPVPLLALLKHPLASGGSERGLFLRRVRDLEMAVLRGLVPAPGLEGLEHALRRTSDPLRHWFAGLRAILTPFAQALERDGATLADVALAHATAAQALARSPNDDKGLRLWRGDAGEAASVLLGELQEHGADMTIEGARPYTDLFREMADAKAVRPAFGRHPRLFILGPLEARLQSFDLTILGGLNEGTWPADAATDPWLSRPMRAAFGLEAPERRVGLAAHDVATLAASPDVLLTRALKQDGTPTVASRWVLRIVQLAKGLGLRERLAARNDLLSHARAIDTASGKRIRPPAPRPPVTARPRRLSVTEIETWVRDPYAIYAKHVLRLKPLDPIGMDAGPQQRGIAIHAALEAFLRAYPETLPPDAVEKLLDLGRTAFAEAGATDAVLALWWPRFERAARWFIGFERERRGAIARSAVEQKGEWTVHAPGGPFVLRGRADRIDLFADGSAAIIDYKTGQSPSHKQIETLMAPQLPLEAAMLLRGAFEGIAATSVRDLIHIKLSGGDPAGEAVIAAVDANAKAEEAVARLAALVARYDDPEEPYPSHAMQERMRDRGDYDHLARVREWSLAGDEE